MATENDATSELTDDLSNRKDDDGAKRLAMAVDRAGGVAVVARRSKISGQSIRRYMKGREMRRSALIELASACDVPVDWLVTGRGPMDPRGVNITITPGADVQGEPSTRPATIYIPIPQFGVRASAGKGQLVTDESINGYLALEDTFLRSTLGRRREDLVGIEAAGDSMEPNIQDGDLLVVDTTVQDIQSSRVYVLDINGELLVKRLSLRLDGSVLVRSDNPKYEPEIVVPSERNTLRIIGQVVYRAGPPRS